MRKIKSRKEKEKEEKVKSITLSIILIILIIISTIGYAFFSNNSNKTIIKKIKYNNIDFFLLEDGRWHFIFENKEFSTYFNPKEILNIPFNLDSSLEIKDYYNKPLYLHYENNKEIEQEIIFNLYNYFQRVNYFCFKQENCSWVEKNCNDENLLIIKKAEKSLITKENGCVFLYYNETEDLKVADAFIFKILRII